jgi:hypothetical protein
MMFRPGERGGAGERERGEGERERVRKGASGGEGGTRREGGRGAEGD